MVNIPHSSKPFKTMHIILSPDCKGFGFVVVGGAEDGTQASVGYIQPGGAADRDGQLQTGDELLFINNICVLNATHKRIVHMIRTSGRRNGTVCLTVRRKLFSYKAFYQNTAGIENVEGASGTGTTITETVPCFDGEKYEESDVSETSETNF